MVGGLLHERQGKGYPRLGIRCSDAHVLTTHLEVKQEGHPLGELHVGTYSAGARCPSASCKKGCGETSKSGNAPASTNQPIDSGEGYITKQFRTSFDRCSLSEPSCIYAEEGHCAPKLASSLLPSKSRAIYKVSCPGSASIPNTSIYHISPCKNSYRNNHRCK